MDLLAELPSIRFNILILFSLFQSHSSLVKMDLYVTSTPSQHQNEIFFITLYLNHTDLQLSSHAFERITPYSVYSLCADNGVDLSLCVCNQNVYRRAHDAESDPGKQEPLTWTEDNLLDVAKKLISDMEYEDMDSITFNIQVQGEDCMFIVRQSNSAGFSYTGFNLCSEAVNIKFTIFANNLILSENKDVTVRFKVGDIVHVLSGVVANMNKEWECDVKTTVVESQ